jgi:hypothetical protein
MPTMYMRMKRLALVSDFTLPVRINAASSTSVTLDRVIYQNLKPIDSDACRRATHQVQIVHGFTLPVRINAPSSASITLDRVILLELENHRLGPLPPARGDAPDSGRLWFHASSQD